MPSNQAIQDQILSTELLDELLSAALKGAIFNAALQLEVWDKIAAGYTSAEAMAKHGGWDISGTRRLLDALCWLGLLAKEAESYQLTPVSEAFLIPGKPTFLGDYLLSEIGFEGHGLLAHAIKNGRRPIVHDWARGEMSALWVDYDVLSRASLQSGAEKYTAFWQELGILAQDGLRVLDVACGSARYSLALAQQNPGLRLTLNDWPGVLEGTLPIAKALGVSDQVRMLPGNEVFTDYGEQAFDLILISEFLHFLGRERSLELLIKLERALAPGGRLVIKETVVDERRCASPALLWSLWLYGGSAQGELFTPSELAGLLQQAGFSQVEIMHATGSLEAKIKAVKI